MNMFMNSVNAAANSRVAVKYACAGMNSEFLMHRGRRVPPFQEADNRIGKWENKSWIYANLSCLFSPFAAFSEA